jgi:hypothetical protein
VVNKRLAAITCRVTSTSMVPFLRRGQLVRVRILRPGTRPLPGAIVAIADDSGQLLVHRLLSWLPDGRCRTGGDALACCDAPWRADQVWGVVAAAQDNQGKWRRPGGLVSRLAAAVQGRRPRLARRLVQEILSRFPWSRTAAGPVRVQVGTLNRFQFHRTRGGAIVVDGRNGNAVVLNQSAARIWELSRIDPNPTRIAVELHREHPGANHRDLAEDVENALAQLRQLGLLPTKP